MPNDQETVLASKASFDGKLEGIDITLHGHFRGELKASGMVRIVEGSEVDANVEAHHVEIGGKFHGQIKSEFLRILGPARASGSFRAQKLSVEEGGQLDGDFEIGGGSTEAQARRSAL